MYSNSTRACNLPSTTGCMDNTGHSKGQLVKGQLVKTKMTGCSSSGHFKMLRPLWSFDHFGTDEVNFFANPKGNNCLKWVCTIEKVHLLLCEEGVHPFNSKGAIYFNNVFFTICRIII